MNESAVITAKALALDGAVILGNLLNSQQALSQRLLICNCFISVHTRQACS